MPLYYNKFYTFN